ncbi:solute carrier family 30 (zinc transporter), member 2 [Nematocida sp. AWRm77]|nr:solute carrier family 30 (zinc transporter), member 2 [Nematocida sp. AWRm77]
MKYTNGMYIVLFNTILLMGIEIAAHYKSNATSVLGEAFHMLGDSASVCLSIGSSFLLRRFKGSRQFTFGLERLEVVSSCISLILLWVPSFYLLYLSACRLVEPEEIDKFVLLGVSFVSFFINMANLAVSLYMCKHSNDMNVSSLYVHALTDLIQSFTMCASGLSLYINPKYVFVDLVCTVIGMCVCFASSYRLSKDVLRMLLDISPLDVQSVRESLLALSQVEAVEDLKIWSLNRRNTMVMAKVSLFTGESHAHALPPIKDMLRKQFDVTYSNIEVVL